jgi:TP901 family phage tail tape measure protein
MAGSKRFTIETVFKIIDKITAPIRKATFAVKQFSRTVKRDFKAAQLQVIALAASIKGTLVTALKTAAMTGMFVLGAGVAMAAREFLNFDQAITQAGVKFKDIKPGTDAYKKTLVELGKTARKVGAETQFSATEAAQGLDFWAMAGVNSQQAMALLPKTVELATATSMDLAAATDIASDALGAFGLMTTDTGKLTENLGRINDVFAKTTTSANTNLEQLFEAAKKGGPDFTAAGQSIETFSAAVGVLASSGIKGGEAGTALRNSILRITADSGPAGKMIKRLGINIKDSKGNFIDYFDIIKQVNKATEKMGNVERARTLDVIFGKKAITKMNVLLQSVRKTTADGTNELEAFRNTLLKSKGAAALMAAEMRKSLLNRLKILGSSLIEVGLKFVDVFSKRGGSAIEDMTKAVSKFDPKPIAQGILNIIDSIKAFVGFIAPFKEIIFGIIAAFALYKIGLMAVAAAQLVVAATNPVTLIILGIGVLIGLVMLLVKHWDKVKSAFATTWNFIKDLFGKVFDFIMEQLDRPIVAILGAMFMPLITIPMLAIKHWNKIKPVIQTVWEYIMFGAAVVWDYLRRFWAWVVEGITTSAQVGIGWMTKLWDSIVSGVILAYDWFMKLIDNPIWAVVLTIFAPWITIPMLIIKHWDKIKAWFTEFWESQQWWISEIVKMLEGLWKGAKAVFGVVGKAASWLVTRQTDEDDEDDEDLAEAAEKTLKTTKGGTLGTMATTRSISESTKKTEVTIKATEGTAATQTGPAAPGVRLVQSGAF